VLGCFTFLVLKIQYCPDYIYYISVYLIFWAILDFFNWKSKTA